MPATKSKKRLAKASYGSKRAKNNLGKIVREYITAIDEKKWVNYSLTNPGSATGLTSTATWQFLPVLVEFNAVPASATGITQGTSAGQRIGNKIKLQGFDLIVNVLPDAGVGAYSGFCRMCVIHDKRSNGATGLTGTDVFTVNSVLGFQNPTNESRFTISNDMVHNIVSTSGTSAGPEGLFKIHIPAKSQIEYNSSAVTTGTLATIINSNYWFAFASDVPSCCSLNVRALVKYTDS